MTKNSRRPKGDRTGTTQRRRRRAPESQSNSSYLQAVPVSSNSFDPATYRDHRNNVKQVVLPNPASGQWQIVTQSIGIPTPQNFGIVISTPPSVP